MGTIYFRLPLTSEILREMESIYLQWFEGTGND